MTLTQRGTGRPVAAAMAAGLLAGLFGGSSAQAQTYYTSSVTVRAAHTPAGAQDPLKDGGIDNREGGAPLGRVELRADSDHDPQQYNGFAHAWTRVDVAGVHVYSFAQAVAGGQGPSRANAQAEARGFFSDFFALSVPGAAPGTLFTVTAQVRSDGVAYARAMPGWTGALQVNQAGAITSWVSWARVIGGSGNLAEVRARQDCVGSTNLGTPASCQSSGALGLSTITFQMANNGAPVQLDLRGFTQAGAAASQEAGFASGEGLADMSNTLAWGGILMLQDASGAVVGDFSALSATSGFDYRLAYDAGVLPAVPEPSPAAMGLAGLALMGAWLRRRRSPTPTQSRR